MCNMIKDHNLVAKFHTSVVSQPTGERQEIFGTVFEEVSGLAQVRQSCTHRFV